MKTPIITLLTDFGTKDYYVASMKGVILNINPGCTIIDVTHDVRPHDIIEGAFLLANAFSFFPKGTIHLSVVDPGVGSARRPVLLVTQNYFFVGPDNGLFGLVSQREKVKKVVVLTRKDYFLPEVGMTFHGRDIFAPVAAHLSLGTRPSAFGYETRVLKDLGIRRPVARDEKLSGEIFHIDTFGNLVSNIDEERLLRFVRGRPFVIRAGRRRIRGLNKGYWEGRRGEPMALIGSGGYLEISVREGNAQKVLKMKRGDPVVVSTESQAALGPTWKKQWKQSF
jgi:S-adenosylmethionine hydrolase